jgi:hypothetical protein
MAETPVDEELRARARRLWEDAGRPQGLEDEYLERARELAALESNPKAGLQPNPLADGVVTPAERGEPVENAAVTDNLGEFPSRFTDQGDRQPFPKPRGD